MVSLLSILGLLSSQSVQKSSLGDGEDECFQCCLEITKDEQKMNKRSTKDVKMNEQNMNGNGTKNNERMEKDDPTLGWDQWQGSWDVPGCHG